jgi:predicted acetyltransferase
VPALTLPTVELHQEWLAAHHDWAGAHQDGSGLRGDEDVESADGFAAFVARLRQEGDEAQPVPTDRVHCSYWWVTEDQTVLGAIALRHELNEFLVEAGGHIGYGIRPSARRRGLAGWALDQVLGHARERGLDRLLLTCDVDNEPSRRTIESRGGVLEDVRDTVLGRVRRYWVTVPAPPGSGTGAPVHYVPGNGDPGLQVPGR